ncbi:MAG: hypothetical protein PHH06_04790 [Candidatus Gracilibacteria bacterium]|nr:hypothetical protein [Candidatus Gracilibacteria bacterium]
MDYEYSLEENYDSLVRQIVTDLIPVLNKDFSFDFDEVYNFVLKFKV